MAQSVLLTAHAWQGKLFKCSLFGNTFAYHWFFCRLGEVCSHIAAILFKVEACVRLGYTSVACTSRPCEWNQAFLKKVCTFYLTRYDGKGNFYC